MVVINKGKYGELLETAGWIQQAITRFHNHEVLILKQFEDTYPNYEVDLEAEPVNILCLDGGGMRGYAICAVMSVIEEKYGATGEEEKDILEYFDLIAGTSIGGAFAVACNVMKTLRGGLDEIRDATDDIRERTFRNFDVGMLMKTGSLVSKEDQIESIVEERWGGEKSFFNPSGPPAMVLCTLKHHSFVRDHNNKQTKKVEYEPFILRTYEYPPSDEENDDDCTEDDSVFANDCFSLSNSSSSVEMYKAIAATTAIPGVVDRVNIHVDGKDVPLADGCIFGDCPIALAIDEARRLYPRRPLGVILSIGMQDQEKRMIEQVINTAKSVNPRLHFQRIAPHEICTKISMAEKDLEKVTIMEEQVREYMQHDETLVSELDETMSRLLSQYRSTKSKYVVEDSSIEQTHRNMMLCSKTFQERTQFRKKVVEARTIASRSGAPSQDEQKQDENAHITNFDEDDNMSMESIISTEAVILTSDISSHEEDNAENVQECYEKEATIGVANDHDGVKDIDIQEYDTDTSMSTYRDKDNENGREEPKTPDGDGRGVFTMCISCFRKDFDTNTEGSDSDLIKTIRTKSTDDSDVIKSVVLETC